MNPRINLYPRIASKCRERPNFHRLPQPLLRNNSMRKWNYLLPEQETPLNLVTRIFHHFLRYLLNFQRSKLYAQEHLGLLRGRQTYDPHLSAPQFQTDPMYQKSTFLRARNLVHLCHNYRLEFSQTVNRTRTLAFSMVQISLYR